MTITAASEPKVKATNLVSLRNIFKDREPQLEQEFLSKLSPEQQRLYTRASVSQWLLVSDVSPMYEAAAKVFFKGMLHPLQQLACLMAGRSYSTIYKIFFRCVSVRFVLNRASYVWSTFNSKGTASIENEKLNYCEMVVRDYPDLPKSFQEIVSGHIWVLMEHAGAKNIQIVLVADDPTAWRWKVRWE